MIGAVIIVVVLVAMPVAICMSMAAVAGLLGSFVTSDVVGGYPPDSEYADLGR